MFSTLSHITLEKQSDVAGQRRIWNSVRGKCLSCWFRMQLVYKFSNYCSLWL